MKHPVVQYLSSKAFARAVHERVGSTPGERWYVKTWTLGNWMLLHETRRPPKSPHPLDLHERYGDPFSVTPSTPGATDQHV